MGALYITIAWPHGESAKAKVVKGPEVSYEDQIDFVRKLGDRINEDYQRVLVSEITRGPIEDVRFINQAEQTRREKQHKAQVKRSYEARQEFLKEEAEKRKEEFVPEPLPPELLPEEDKQPEKAEKPEKPKK